MLDRYQRRLDRVGVGVGSDGRLGHRLDGRCEAGGVWDSMAAGSPPAPERAADAGHGDEDMGIVAAPRGLRSSAPLQRSRPKSCRKNRKMLKMSMKMVAASGIASSCPPWRRRLKSTTV